MLTRQLISRIRLGLVLAPGLRLDSMWRYELSTPLLAYSTAVDQRLPPATKPNILIADFGIERPYLGPQDIVTDPSTRNTLMQRPTLPMLVIITGERAVPASSRE